MKKLIAICFLAFGLMGCEEGESSDASYSRGYKDGYAAGYNTTCKHGATLVAADWDNKHYSQGYSAGNRAGITACRNK